MILIQSYFIQTTSLTLTNLVTEIPRTMIQRRPVREASAKPTQSLDKLS